jgi:hypothetical protein
MRHADAQRIVRAYCNLNLRAHGSEGRKPSLVVQVLNQVAVLSAVAQGRHMNQLAEIYQRGVHTRRSVAAFY